MPMRGNRTKRDHDHRRDGDMDWFSEDPWSDRELASFDDDWEPDLWGTVDEDLSDWDEAEEDASVQDEDEDDDEDHDGWGPVRRRTKQRRKD